jgi:hypothetical protein
MAAPIGTAQRASDSRMAAMLNAFRLQMNRAKDTEKNQRVVSLLFLVVPIV